MLVLRITSTADLMERSLLLAKKLDLSAYDACYAVLAQQLEIPLVTADQPPARKLDSAIFLGDLDIPMWQEELHRKLTFRQVTIKICGEAL